VSQTDLAQVITGAPLDFKYTTQSKVLYNWIGIYPAG
jgi:hypothetical protein